MRVLLIGSGGREHALAWKCLQSPFLTKLIVSPGNAGIARIAECVALDAADHDAVIAFCRSEEIDLVVIGPEAPLVAGLVDDLAAAGIQAFGPTRAAAQLEGSKAFTKAICKEYAIPTARYEVFTDADAAHAYVNAEGAPIVIKADGLAAGKGVTVALSLEEAHAAIDALKDGDGRIEAIIEECLTGPEASFFAFVDGTNVMPLGTAQDHKRAYDNDEGPNTGGMGAFSPAVVLDDRLIDEAVEKIVRPTARAMVERGTPYRGILYAGLMITPEGPKLIEYNVRFGDPECQVLMMRLQSDLLDLITASVTGRLAEMAPDWSEEPAMTVVMATRGYPGPYQKGSVIGGLDAIEPSDNQFVFHAGTSLRDGAIVATGGRVLNVTALGGSLAEARDKAYGLIERIDWPEGFYRTDIGARAIETA